MEEAAGRKDAVTLESGDRRRGLRLQVATMLLTAFIPVAWLIGRRAVPAPGPKPFLLAPGEPAIALPGSASGLAGGVVPTRLPPPLDPNGAFRLRVLLMGPGDSGRPPYRLVLEGPQGQDLWQGAWSGPEIVGDPGFELILPAAGLRPGRYALRVEDAARMIRIYPFIVP